MGAFQLPRDGDVQSAAFDLRWFTPTEEVDLSLLEVPDDDVAIQVKLAQRGCWQRGLVYDTSRQDTLTLVLTKEDVISRELHELLSHVREHAELPPSLVPSRAPLPTPSGATAAAGEIGE